MTAIREIRIQYDNLPPDISAPYGGAIPIKNSNGWYELKSSVVEAQSGFAGSWLFFTGLIPLILRVTECNPL